MKNFYEVGYTWLDEIEITKGKETIIKQKKVSEKILVLTHSCAEAEKIAVKEKSKLLDFNVKRVAKTKIVGVVADETIIENEGE